MTADPRIIECAKALAEAGEMMVNWVEASEGYKEARVEQARAVILKWLEQELSDTTVYECGNIPSPEYGRILTTPKNLRALYAAICDQAKKEITIGDPPHGTQGT